MKNIISRHYTKMEIKHFIYVNKLFMEFEFVDVNKNNIIDHYLCADCRKFYQTGAFCLPWDLWNIVMLLKKLKRDIDHSNVSRESNWRNIVLKKLYI